MSTVEKKEVDFDTYFESYDIANPDIWALFEDLTLMLIKSGRKQLSSEMIINRIRWEGYVTSKNSDGYKVNNNIKPYYSRKFLKLYPEYEGVFKKRHSKADAII